MKAIVCHEFGPIAHLSYEEVEPPKAGANDVIIASQSIGVNFPDGLLVQGLYQSKPQLPFIPGMEVVGEIVELGSNVKGFQIGQRVAALSMIGAFAEQVKVDCQNLMPIPDEANGDDMTALMCGFGTAHHGLKQRGNLQAGETLVVTGASGLTGLAAVQIGKAMGARVIGVASSNEKREICKQHGADIVLGYDNLKEEIKAASDGRGADVVFEVIGGQVFDACSRAMAWGGRLLVVGFASGVIPRFPVNLALVKGYSVCGVFWGSFAAKQPKIYQENMQELMGWYFTGKVAPLVDRVYALKDAAKALTFIHERNASGKVVLNP